MKKTVRLVFIINLLVLQQLLCYSALFGQDTKGIIKLEVKKNNKPVFLYKKSVALLIGVSKYAKWPNLNSVPREMDNLAKELEKQGFNIESSFNPTSEELRKTIKVFIDRFGFERDNRLLIFFSGHGYTRKDNGKGYIVPSDAEDPLNNEVEFSQSAIDMDQIMAWARRIEAKHALFVFDSCFSGAIFKTKNYPTPSYINHLTGQQVRQFITAGSANETVPARSYFIEYFIRGIQGEADAYRDGYITATELGLYLQKEIEKYQSGQTPQYGKIRDPQYDKGDFVFITDLSKSKIKPVLQPFHSFSTIEYAEKDKNKLIAYDQNGNQLIKRFESSISNLVIDDIDQDGNNDIVLGFGSGKRSQDIIAFDSVNSELHQKWQYELPKEHPYPGEQLGVFRVLDLKVYSRDAQKIVVFSITHEMWYQSALIIIDSKGKKLKEFWHPGRMYQLEKLEDIFVIRAVNNDLKISAKPTPQNRHHHAVFGLTFDNIYGQGPPYYGNGTKNKDFQWYYLLSTLDVTLSKMEKIKDEIVIHTDCGQFFYLNRNGLKRRVGRSDFYTCKQQPRFFKLNFTNVPQ